MTGLGKRCSKCGGDGPFFKNSAFSDGLDHYCKTCRKPVNDAKYAHMLADPVAKAEHRDYQRWSHIKRNYGVTKEQWLSKFDEQGHRCAACGSTEYNGKNWHTDHVHETGEFRGILCHPCNVTLGNAGDSLIRLRDIVQYLEKWSKSEIPASVQEVVDVSVERAA